MMSLDCSESPYLSSDCPIQEMPSKSFLVAEDV